ncbi:PKD domain-containing protein [Intrasporangium flavum]|uniref:PKD domain-containing protein n=1 Tax=Intrasporangium flavum TaxID=1428657 RepID=UPI00096C8D9D|nr:right-handed parallel beta-helix repeat-containing protein [Intrasporangium flavum]
MKLRAAVSTVAVGALALGWQLVVAPPASAATAWFVDGANPACSDQGAGTSAAPFCTISRAAVKAVTAGDTVTVAPGTYREQVSVGASGAAGVPITFVASAPGVVVSGTKDLSTATWTDASGGTFSTPFTPASVTKQVFLDGARLAAGTSATGLAAGSFFFDSTAKVLYVNLGGPSPSGRAVEAGAQTYGFNLSGRSNVVVDGFTTTGQNGVGLRVSAGSAVTLRNVTSTFSASYGVLLESSSTNVTVTNARVRSAASIGIRLSATTASTITGANVAGSGNHGISLQGSVGNTVQGSESADNVVTAGTATAAGIDVSSSSTDTVLRGNVVHGNQDTGIQVYSGSSRTVVVRNTSWGNGNHGFDTLASTGVSYLSNTSYGNHDDGISVEGNSTGATLRNNISVDNGLGTGRHDLYVEQTSMTGFTADSDVFWNSRWVPAVRIGLTRYQTLSDFAAGTGLEAAGLGSDPQFVDAAAHDFRLAAQSAAVDSADAGAPGFEATDAAGNPPTDDPTVPDRGAGTPTYADRGALERQPQAGDQATNAPHAALVLSATTGQVPPAVTVTADARGSSDVDTQGIATYTFDFGDGTVVGPQASPVATHDFVATGTPVVTVTVADTGGLTGTAVVPVTLTDRPLVTYHVDGTSPSCSDAADGTTTPFCSISRAAALALAGDTVVVEAGDYREQVTPARTGMTTAPLTFRANGAVRVLGTTDLGSTSLWTPTSTTAWQATVASAAPITQVFRGGTRLAAASSATTTTAGTFFYDAAATTLYVDAGGANPASGTTLEASTRSYGFKLWNARSVVVDGFSMQGQNGVGISIQDSADVVVTSARASLVSSYGVSSDRSSRTRVSGSTTTGNGSIGVRIATSPDAVVSGNTSASNGYHGISIQSSTGATVADNVSHDNVQPTQRLANGIDVSLGSTGALVERNTVYANQDSGIEIYTGSDDATVRRNISYDNGDHGIDCLSSQRDHVVGNTVVGNSTAGINLEGGCSSSLVADNVSVDNAVGSTRTIGNIRLDEASSPGSTVNRNLVFQNAGGPLYEWNSAPYTTVASFQVASGQGPNDLGSAPRFVDEAGRNLALTLTSPAVDSADLGVTGASVTDHDGIAPVDVPVIADTGAGSPAYGDRGALEYHGNLQPTGPTAALSANPATGAHAPATVQLSASGSSAGDGAITSYTFTCGNGTTVGPQAGATASCTYASAGTYTASVRVVDQFGLASTASTSVGVLAPYVAPRAAFTATPRTGVVPFPVALDASGSSDPEGGSLTYTFVCGTGTTVGPQASPTATCTYAKTGTFTVQVTVRSSVSGLSASATTTVTASANKAPTASLTLVTPPATVAPATATLDASGSKDPEGRPLTYTFACGNATTVGPQASAQATCSYPAGGSFKATVTVTDDAGNKTTSAPVTVTVGVNKAPTARLTVTLSKPTAPTVATLDASGSTDPEKRPLTYTYACGNGTVVGPTSATSATCTLSTKGTYQITLTVTDDVGQKSSVTVRTKV